jgi:hypothetical protein
VSSDRVVRNQFPGGSELVRGTGSPPRGERTEPGTARTERTGTRLRPSQAAAGPEAGGFAVALEGGELVIRIRLAAQPVDELVAVCAEGLAPFGLELRAVQSLIAEGKLRAVQIGRRRFTKRSLLLALVDELEVHAAPERDAKAADVLTLAASKAARRASARNRTAGKGAAA